MLSTLSLRLPPDAKGDLTDRNGSTEYEIAIDGGADDWRQFHYFNYRRVSASQEVRCAAVVDAIGEFFEKWRGLGYA